ncbi:Major Facilitator Superfamily, partial [Aspergillus sp. HF37]
MSLASEDGSKHPPWLLRLRSSTGFIAATVWMSNFTDYFLYAMIVPVMPSALVERANVPYEDREYWVSVLLMSEAGVACIACPVFGYLVDVSPSRKLPYQLGLILLGGSMGLLAVADTVWKFVAARLLQGGASAVVVVGGLALMTDSVAADNLGLMIGYLGSAVTLGFLLGPFLGGLVYDAAGYHAVFIVAFGIVAVDLVMRFAVVEKSVARSWSKGLLSDRQSADYQTLPRECPPEQPAAKRGFVLPLLLRQPRILLSSWALLVQGLIYAAFDSTLPVFVETRFGWTAFGAGMAFLPGALSAFFNPYFGHISDRHGNRPVTITAFLLLTPTLILLRLITHNTLSHKTLLFTLEALAGLFLNLCMPALFVETQQTLDAMEAREPGVFGAKGAVAQGFGIQTMAQFAGLFCGPVVGG